MSLFIVFLLFFFQTTFYILNSSLIFSYFENIDRITGKKYIPNTTDIVKSRIRTIGVVETEFIVDNHIIRMYDVGGQRSERRKWIQCFEDVRTLLFVVAISEYDMTLVEDSSRNRLKESLLLFESISNNLFFHNTCTVSGCSIVFCSIIILFYIFLFFRYYFSINLIYLDRKSYSPIDN